jgi:flagella basal body P-ring formation protein FlgA
VINKDESVTVQFRTGGVALTLQGKALTGAAAGETLRVLNPQSKMIIDAVAVGPGVAVVGRDAAGLKPARLAARP